MDKRFILIILIIILGVFNLYIISEYSDVIGSASVDVSKYTFSLPKDFILLNTNNQNDVAIYNTKTGLNIMVSVIPKYNSSYKFASINNDTNTTVLSNGTINRNDITIDSIYYNNVNHGNKPPSVAIFYFKKDDASFKITMDNFNYESQREETIDALLGIIDSIRINHKM